VCCKAFPKLAFDLARALKMAGKKRASSGGAADDELIASEETLIAKWNELSDERVKEQAGKYRNAIKDLESKGTDKGPSTFEYEEEVEVEVEEHEERGAGEGVQGGENVLGETEGGEAADDDDGLIEGNVDDIDPREWMVPPQCIPVHANVVTYDWSKIYNHTDFDVIMMDPPWQLATANPTRGVSLGYSQLTDLHIADLPLPKLQKNGFLFVWVINAKYQWCLEQFKKWGYEFVDEVVWVKVTNSRRMAKSHGFYLQHAKEVCLVGRRGNLPPGMADKAVGSDIIFAERRGQSQKPTEIYELIEELVPSGKYLEIFARKNNLRDYWVSVGNEVTGTGLPPEDEKAFDEHGVVPGAKYGAGAQK
jgi:mRNA (2'-O-methyladenosine-N6-)-methyltransferase